MSHSRDMTCGHLVVRAEVGRVPADIRSSCHVVVCSSSASRLAAAAAAFVGTTIGGGVVWACSNFRQSEVGNQFRVVAVIDCVVDFIGR